MAGWLLALLLSSAPGTPSHAPDAEPLMVGSFNQSVKCARCHVEIYRMWSRSMHSNSYSDPIFQVSYMHAYLETSGKASEFCLRCHAPAAFLSGDLEMRSDVSREGIGCDFCHSITSVNLDNPDRPYEVSLDGVKRGPLRNTASPAHNVERSGLHESAELCAACHQYTNPAGLPILTTYDEWRVSPQAKAGKTCQHCHMPLKPGSTVRTGLGIERTSINLHDISGMHSNEQVRKAVRGRLVSVERKSPRLAEVVVEIENVGSGHSVPTGLPTRKLILDVTVFCDREMVKQVQRVYQRVLLDEKGLQIQEDHRVMLSAGRLMLDNRIQAGERRVERFTVKVPRKGSLRATMALRYSYEPMLLTREHITIDLASEALP